MEAAVCKTSLAQLKALLVRGAARLLFAAVEGVWADSTARPASPPAPIERTRLRQTPQLLPELVDEPVGIVLTRWIRLRYSQTFVTLIRYGSGVKTPLNCRNCCRKH